MDLSILGRLRPIDTGRTAFQSPSEEHQRNAEPAVDADQEAWEERAAIIEFDAGAKREDAEHLAGAHPRGSVGK